MKKKIKKNDYIFATPIDPESLQVTLSELIALKEYGIKNLPCYNRKTKDFTLIGIDQLIKEKQK